MRNFLCGHISERINALLKKNKKTKAWLADEAGIQKGYLSELMNGHPEKRWNEDTLAQVIKAFDISTSAFFSDETPMEHKKIIDAYFSAPPELRGVLDMLLFRQYPKEALPSVFTQPASTPTEKGRKP